MEDISQLLIEMYGLSETEALGIGTVYESPEDLEQMDKECAQLSEAFWKKRGLNNLLKKLQKKPDLVLPPRSPPKKPDLVLPVDDDDSLDWYSDPDDEPPLLDRHKYDCQYTLWDPDDEPMENYLRDNRGLDAADFRMNYNFIRGKKICITSKSSCSWESDQCYDSTWVVVHGMDSVCMVTWRRDVDMTRVEPYYRRCCTNQQTMRDYAEAVICEVESLPYDDDLRDYDVREMFGQSIEKPFGVVCVVSDTKKVDEESGHEASSAEYDEEKATTLLMKKMKSGLAFTCDETIQTAISGFQHLCLEELKAEDIWVTTLKIEKDLFEHMHIDQRKEHLAVISGGSSGGL